MSRPAPTTLASRRERRLAARADRAARPQARPQPRGAGTGRSPFVIVIVTALAAVAGLALVVGLALGNRTPEPPAAGFVRPPVSAAAAFADVETTGRSDAPVTLEVVSDFQCPVCGRFARDYLPRLVTEFVEPGDLRIVHRSIDILGTGTRSESEDAAVAASCAARQGRFWPYHDLLFWNQEGENEGAFAPDRLRAMADELELDGEVFDACISDPSVAGGIRRATADSLAAGINSTPTFLVNGERIAGLVPYEQLAGAIRAKLPAS